MDRSSKTRLPPSNDRDPVHAEAAANGLSAEERAVLQAIRSTPFGAIEVVLHQSRIVQIVKTEKVRLEGAALSA